MQFTYRQLHAEVCKFTNTLESLGVVKGDRVAIYMPLIPEIVFAVLACARIGAIHSVIFAGFTVDSIKGRIVDSTAKLVVTTDIGYRRGRPLPLK